MMAPCPHGLPVAEDCEECLLERELADPVDDYGPEGIT
jgi:hypothetical protein